MIEANFPPGTYSVEELSRGNVRKSSVIIDFAGAKDIYHKDFVSALIIENQNLRNTIKQMKENEKK